MPILHFITNLDRELLLAINGSRTPVFDWLMPILSDFNKVAPALAILIAWRLWKGNNYERIMWIGVVAAVLIGDMLCARILKPLVARPRPFIVTDGIHLYKKGEWLLTTPGVRAHLAASMSWPSCHAVNAWTAAGFILRYSRVWGIFLATIALGISYSRVYLGVHYPLDVICGGIIGILWGWLAAASLRRTFSADKDIVGTSKPHQA